MSEQDVEVPGKEYNKRIDLYTDYGDGIGAVEYVEHYGSDLSFCNAARVSFGKHKTIMDEKDVKLLRYMIEHKHTSPFEHGGVTFRFMVPLFTRGQHHRHRTWCLAGDNELYFDLPGGIERRGNQLYKLTLKEVFERFQVEYKKNNVKKMMLRCLNEETKELTHTHIVDCWSSGEKILYNVVLKNGHSIRCSKDHRLYTNNGWMTLEEILNSEKVIEVACLSQKKTADDNEHLLPKNREERCELEQFWQPSKLEDISYSECALIPGYDSKYMITRTGQVYTNVNTRNRKLGFWKEKKISISAGGYEVVSLSKNSKTTVRTIHTLMAESFLNLEPGQIVRHVNDIRWDNRIENLLVGSHKENAEDRRKNGNDPFIQCHYSPIEECYEDGVEETYDIEVKEPFHNFVCNGVVTHNSYNEISRRYTDFNLQFYNPTVFRTQHKSNRQASNIDELINPEVEYQRWSDKDTGEIFRFTKKASELVKEHVERSVKLYNSMLDAGICREQARMVLPQNMYVQYYGTVNLSNLLKFIDLRDHEGSQEEIARVARACLEIATDLFPVTVKAYREIRGHD